MAASGSGMSDRGDHWDIPIDGGEVTQVQVDYALGLRIETYDERKATTVVRINTAFEFEADGVLSSIDPVRTTQLAPLVTLHKAAVKEGSATKTGHLRILFADGRGIHVAPHPQYEAWQVTGELSVEDSNFQLIGLPSTGVALF